MTGDGWTWTLAALQFVAAAGIVAFWFTWFRQPHAQTWLPAGYVEHERVFVFADGVLAIVLVAGGILQVMERSLGASGGLVAAGMLAFLGILDLAYFAQNGLFKREREGVKHAGIVGGVLVLSVLLGLRFA